MDAVNFIYTYLFLLWSHDSQTADRCPFKVATGWGFENYNGDREAIGGEVYIE